MNPDSVLGFYDPTPTEGELVFDFIAGQPALVIALEADVVTPPAVEEEVSHGGRAALLWPARGHADAPPKPVQVRTISKPKPVEFDEDEEELVLLGAL